MTKNCGNVHPLIQMVDYKLPVIILICRVGFSVRGMLVDRDDLGFFNFFLQCDDSYKLDVYSSGKWWSFCHGIM